MLDTYAEQQKTLGNKPNWVPVKTKFAQEPDEYTVTHVNQTRDLFVSDRVGMIESITVKLYN